MVGRLQAGPGALAWRPTNSWPATPSFTKRRSITSVRSKAGIRVWSHEVIKEGFQFEGKRWPLVNPQRGIFKPSSMPFLLSIRTVFPKKGGRVWYDDQRNVHRQIFAGEEVLDLPLWEGTRRRPRTRGSGRLPTARSLSSTSSALARALPGHHPHRRGRLGCSPPERADRVRRARGRDSDSGTAGFGGTALRAAPGH